MEPQTQDIGGVLLEATKSLRESGIKEQLPIRVQAEWDKVVQQVVDDEVLLQQTELAASSTLLPSVNLARDRRLPVTALGTSDETPDPAWGVFGPRIRHLAWDAKTKSLVYALQPDLAASEQVAVQDALRVYSSRLASMVL